jgi:serine/threonine-protein kinase HSL1 (negative regulator of Swe1 kinase)
VKIISARDVAASRASLHAQAARAEKQRLGIDREIIMMKLMDHPNIMGMYDVWEGDEELYETMTVSLQILAHISLF